MGFSLRDIFGPSALRHAGMLTLALALGASSYSAPHPAIAESQEPVSATSDEGGMCIDISQRTDFLTAEQQALAGVLETVRRSSVGRHIMDVAGNDNTSVCFDPEMNKPNLCGATDIGLFDNDGNRVDLNPAFERVMTTNILVHETRHKEQRVNNITWRQDGNFTGAERVILKWLTEADARVSSIAFAYEMQQAGHPDYMEALRESAWHTHMVAAFENSLQTNPDNIPVAMAAAVMAFRDNAGLARSYDNAAANWIDLNDVRFDPAAPAETLLTDALLERLGAIGPYGNYMSDDLKSFIRNSYSDSDYQRLSEARLQARQAAGTAASNQPTCS